MEYAKVYFRIQGSFGQVRYNLSCNSICTPQNIFNTFLFWCNFKLTENFARIIQGLPYTLHPDSPIVLMLSNLLCASLSLVFESLYISIHKYTLTYICIYSFFLIHLEKLEILYPFIPKYLGVYFLKLDFFYLTRI